MKMYLTTEQVAKLLNISMPTIYRWVKERKIPHVRRGHRILFIENQINEWLNVTNTFQEESFIHQLKRA